MSKEIDERVVSMQFDNALFEKNIQKSLKSIDDLNKSLNNLDGAKGLEEVSKAAKEVDLTPIIASAKNAEKSFSALEIAGITTISRLTNSLINFGAKMGKNFWDSTIGQIKSGGWKRASDIKAGKFMLEGLGLGDKNVELLSEAAQKAVKGTAAGLGEAMKSAGVLATSGLKDAQKMEETLKGIAGMSAMTGRSFENIANIYSTVASNGKLMTMQMRQFSFAGINVAAELAKQMGKTEAEINDMVTKGKIDFQTFADAMTEAFGDHAKDANKTFTGALANMKAALSRIGENFATPFMDNAKDVFNVLRVFFDSVKEAMGPVFQDFSQLMKLGNMFIHKVFSPFVERARDAKGEIEWKAKDQKILSNIVEGIRNIYSTVILVFKTIGEAFREVFPSLEDTSEGFKDITRSIMPTRQGLELLKTILIPILEILKTVGTVLKYTITFASYFVKVIAAVVHALTGATGGFTEWMKQAREGKTLATALEKVFDILAGAVLGLGAAIIGVLSLIQKLIKKLGEFFKFDFGSIKQVGVNIISGICKGLEAGFGVLQKVWTAIAEYIPNTIKSILKIKSPSRVMMSVGSNVILGVANGMESKEPVLNKSVEDTGNILSKIVDFGALIADALGKTAYAAIEGLINLFKKLTGKVDNTNLKKTTASLIETKEVMNDLYMSGTPTSTTTTSQIIKMGDDWTNTNTEVEKSTSSLKDTVSGAYNTISKKMEELGINIDAFKLILAGFGIAIVATLTQAAFSLNLLSGLGRTIATLSVIAGAFLLLKNVDLTPTIDGIKTLFSTLKTFTDNLNIADNIKKFFNKMRGIVEENNMLMLASKALAFTFAIVLIRTIHSLAVLAMNISMSVRTIATAFNKLASFKLGIYETTADKILKFALALSVISGAIAVLSAAFDKNPDAVWNTVKVIGGLVALFMVYDVLMKIVIKYGKQATTANTAIKELLLVSYSILGLVASFTLLVLAFNAVGWESAIMGFFAFGAALISFGALFKYLDGTKVSISPGTVISLSIFMLTITSLMKSFKDMFEDSKGIKDLALAFTKMVAPIMAALFGIALILKTLQTIDSSSTIKGRSRKGLFGLINNIVGDEYSSKKSDISGNAVKTLLAMSALLITLGGVMKVMGSLEPDQFNRAIVGLTVGFALIGTLFAAIIISGAQITSVSGFIKDFAIAMIALAGTIAIMSNLTPSEFEESLGRVVKIAIIIAGSLAAASLVFKLIKAKAQPLIVEVKGLGMTLASLALGLAALGAIFALMPEEKLEEFAKWTQGLIVCILGAVLVMNILTGVLSSIESIDGETKNKFGDKKKGTSPFVSMLGMILGIATVMGALVVLSLMDPQSLIMPLVSIGVLLVALSLMFAQIAKMKDMQNVLGVFIFLTLIISALSASLVALSLIPMDNIDQMKYAALSIMGILGELAIIFYILNNLNIDTKAIFAVASMTALILAIGGMLTLLATFGGQNIESAKNAVMWILGVIGAITAIVGLFGVIKGEGVSAALISLAIAIGAFGAAVLAIGIGVSLIILATAAALVIMKSSLEALQNVDFDHISNGLKEIATAMLDFGVKTAAGVALIGLALGLLFKNVSTFVAIGAMIMAGLGLGIKGNTKKATSAAEYAADAVTDTFKDGFIVASPSKLFRKIGGFLMEGLKLGIIDKIPVVGNTIKEFVTNVANWFNDKADTLEETGDNWGNALKVGLGDALGDMDFETPSISDEIAKLTENFDMEAAAADDSALSLDGYTDATSDATKGTDNLKNSIANALDMFSGFDDTANMTGKDVINSFQEQIRGVAKWRDELASLSARGLGEVIIQELESLGPQAYEKVHAFYTMTNSELAMMNIMYKQKLTLQNGTSKKIAKSFGKLTDDVTDELEQGIDEMGDTLTDSVTDMAGNMMKALKKQMDYEKVINQVTGFRDNIADKIRNSMSIFEAVNEQEEVKAEELLDNMKAQVKHVGKWASMITEMAGKGFSEGLVATLTEMGPQSYSKVAAFLTMSEDQIEEANRLFEASEQVPEYGADKIVKAFADAGFTASMGLTDSFLEGLDPEAVEEALGDLANKSISTLQYEMDHPVSAWDIGNEWAGAFADGLHAALEDAKTQAKQDMEDLKDIVEETEEERAQRQMNAYNANRQYYDQRYINQLRESNANAEKEERAKAAAEKAAYERSRDYAYSNQIHMNSTGPKKTYDTEMEYRNKYVKDRDFIYRTTEQSDEKFDELLKAYYGNRVNEFVKENYQSIASLGGAKMKVNTEYDIYKMIQSGMMYDDNASVELKKYVNDIIDDAQGNIFEGYYTLGSGARKAMAEGMQEDKELGKAAIDAGNVTICGYTGQSFAGGGSGTLKTMNKDQMFNTPLGKGLIDLGGYSGMAAAEGVNTEGVAAMEEAGQNLASSFIISLRDNLANLMDAILNSDDASAPKIKPVFDGSNVVDGIKSLFGKNLDLSTSANIDVSTKTRDKNVVDAINAMSNDDVVNAVNDLKDLFNMRVGDLMNLSVVMDTGALVGQIGRPIDQYLGAMSINAGRGIS